MKPSSFTGKGIKKVRDEWNMSQDKFAKMLGTTQTRISHWEAHGVPEDPITRKGLETVLTELAKKYRVKEFSKGR